MNRFLASALLPFAMLGGCGTLGSTDGEPVGSVRATISQVPPQVFCVQILAGGTTNSYDVQPGTTVVETIKNLRAGNETFVAYAYGSTCAGTTPGSTASWASAPTQAIIYPGQLTNVSLLLEPAGGANVGVGFDSDGGVPIPPDLTVPAQAQLTVSPTSWDAGNVKIGTAAPNQTFTVVNSGSAPTGPITISTSSPMFNAGAGTCAANQVLQAGQSCTFIGSFAGSNIPSHATGSITVSAMPGGSVTIMVQGTSVP